jgi:hypothetical protein
MSTSRSLIRAALVLSAIGGPAGGAAAGTAIQAVAPAGAGSLIAHRAVYDLSLGETRGSSSVEEVRGRIVYDFSGNACQGYALKFRQVTEIGISGGGSNMSDLRSTSVEDDAGKNYRFTSQNYVNQKLDTSIDGKAQREAGGAVEVALDKPVTKTFELPDGVIFPTGQTKAIVEIAEKGGTIFESKVYDGSDGGQKVYSSLAVIGRRIAPDQPREGAAAGRSELNGVDRWPVTISYFDPAKPAGGEQTPIYSISFDLYANGISDKISLDYGDFTLKGAMTSLEILPQAACK